MPTSGTSNWRYPARRLTFSYEPGLAPPGIVLEANAGIDKFTPASDRSDLHAAGSGFVEVRDTDQPDGSQGPLRYRRLLFHELLHEHPLAPGEASEPPQPDGLIETFVPDAPGAAWIVLLMHPAAVPPTWHQHFGLDPAGGMQQLARFAYAMVNV